MSEPADKVFRLAQWERLRLTVGSGTVRAQNGLVNLEIDAQDGTDYCNAQLDDYSGDGFLRWRPPVRLSIRARFSHAQPGLLGTSGFGFWNDPFGMAPIQVHPAWLPRLRLPQSVWFFFAAPPSALPWAHGVPGTGWKAATLDAARWRTRLLLPFAPVGMLLCRWRWAYTRVWPWVQEVLKIDERLLSTSMQEWHDYDLVWDIDEVRFWIDKAEVFRSPKSPRGPLGLVIWIDNQTMVATPQGIIRQGVVATGVQRLEISSLEVRTLHDGGAS